MSNHDEWVDKILPAHKRLTESTVTILENLLKSKEIDHLSVSGRTKDKKNILEKISRKKYNDPASKMTDLTGIRVIVYLESDIAKVSEIIESAFAVDFENSANQDEHLSVNQIGYRSVHYVCDLGKDRAKLPEFYGLESLKFEIQVRTVLQHAWAELAHDRNYKFSDRLPPNIERSLYLYAGMLEIADKGFNDLSKQIDEYISNVHDKIAQGDLNYQLDSISLKEFVDNWSKKNIIPLEDIFNKTELGNLLSELEQFGITTAEQLDKIIPNKYAEKCRANGYSSNIFGYVRDWMLISDWRKFMHNVKFNWVLTREHIYNYFMEPDEFEEFSAAFDWDSDYSDDDQDVDSQTDHEN